MKKVLKYTLTIILIFGLFSCKDNDSVLKKQLVSPKEMQELLNNEEVQLIDVRTPAEYKDGYVADAININFYDVTFAQDVAKLDKSKPVYVYCKRGGRSAKAASKLRTMGFIEVFDMKGGFDAWKSHKLPVKK